jgi:hypothetical protein
MRGKGWVTRLTNERHRGTNHDHLRTVKMKCNTVNCCFASSWFRRHLQAMTAIGTCRTKNVPGPKVVAVVDTPPTGGHFTVRRLYTINDRKLLPRVPRIDINV